MANIRIPILTVALLASIVVVANAEDVPARHRPPPKNAPTNELQQAEYLLHLWRMQSLTGLTAPAWETNIPTAERIALKAAAVKGEFSNNELRSELLHQAKSLSSEPSTLASGERLFLLAAKEGAIDVDALARIVSTSTSDLRRNLALRHFILEPV